MDIYKGEDAINNVLQMISLDEEVFVGIDSYPLGGGNTFIAPKNISLSAYEFDLALNNSTALFTLAGKSSRENIH